MPVNYFDTEQLIADKLSDVTAEADVESLERLGLAVSRFIDNYCKRPVDYFAAMPTGEDTPAKTVRRFRSTGERFLRIPRHVAGSVELTNPAIAADRFYESEANGWLYPATQPGVVGDDYFAGDGVGQVFLNGALYEVTAHWYFAETPADILEAGKQIIESIWAKGKGVIGDVSPDGFVIDRAIPLTAAAMLKPYIKRQFEVE